MMNDIEDIYDLCPLQNGMLLHSILEEGSGIFVEHFTFPIRGTFEPELLKRAWELVVTRHTALRTSFHWEGIERPVQVVHRCCEIPFAMLDWRNGDGAIELRMTEHLAQDRRHGFELDVAPLLRVTVIRTADREWRYVWTFHHLLLDGWSAQIVNGEIAAAYDAFAQGREPSLPPRQPFVNYVAWLQHRDKTQADAFWRRVLAGFTTATPLPLERESAVGGSGYENVIISWPESVSGEMKEFARRRGVTVSSLVHAAWAILLARTTGAEDVVFGSLVSGRPPQLPGVESMVGLFINTVPVRAKVSFDKPVLALALELQATLNQARDFEYSTLVDIMAVSELPERTALFQTLLVFENLPRSASAASADAPNPIGFQQSNYPLTILAGAEPVLWLKFLYDTRYYDAATIERIAGYLRVMLQGIVRSPERSAGDLPMLTEVERRRILFEWNETAREYDFGKRLAELFAEQAAKTPDSAAFLLGDSVLTYRDLDRRSNALAAALRERGATRGSVVGVFARRSFEAAIGLIGILKAGAVYLPLDASDPAERRLEMLAEAGACTVVSEEMTREECESFDQMDVGPDDLAYIIFTSGSTGKRKGVAVEYRQVLNRLHWMWERYPFQAGEVACQKTALTFVDSLWEMLGALLRGVPTVIFGESVVRDPRALIDGLAEARVTRLWLVPSLLRALLDSCDDLAARLPHLRFWVTTGEPLTPEIARRFAASMPRAVLYNLYGTSEVWDATWQDPQGSREPAELTPIGRPIANVRTYILDARRAPVPPGVAGELYVGGIGLARGYLGKPAQTNERFVPDCFAATDGARMYRTGDVARYRADGVIDYIGRADRLIKIRGYRVEPAEIEAVLAQHSGVRQAIVTAYDVGDDPWLAAFILPKGHAVPDIAEVRKLAAARLPEYMIPATFSVIDHIPCTATGKLNRDALPRPSRTDMQEVLNFEPPATDLEHKVAAIWADLLPARSIGRNDDFFRSGGHSLVAMSLVARLRNAFGIDLPLRVVFDEPTVAQMARAIDTILWAASASQPSSANLASAAANS